MGQTVYIYQSFSSTNNLENVYGWSDGYHLVDSYTGSVPGMTVNAPAEPRLGVYTLSGTPTATGTYTITFSGTEGAAQTMPYPFTSTWTITVLPSYTHTINYAANGGSGSMQPTVVRDINNGNTNVTSAANGFNPPTGYHFTGWSYDGQTYQPGTQFAVGPNGSITLSAVWETNTYTVSLTPSPSDKGSVTGAGSYTYGSSVTITATPISHYHLVNWSDGDTSASRTFTITSDVALTANFAIDTFEIKWANWDGSTLRTDTVAYGSTPSYGGTPTRPATAQYTYTFTGWTPTIESATGPETYTAQYASTINRYAVTLSTSGNGSGTVSISPSGGTYDYGTQVTISATANEHSHFNQWSDGVTDNPRTFTVTGPVTLSAEIALDLCIISVQTDGDGEVTGAGTYNYGDTVTLTATARKLSKFIKWTLDGWTLNGSEEVYNNPLTFQAVEDVSVTAYFETINGVLILSYTEGGQIYTLECGTVTAVSDTVRANILQTPIPVYSADNAFTFDTGATDNLQINIVRRNPEHIVDPGNIPDNVPDIYEVDWSKYDTARWSNRVWKMALISMIDRWQMKSDGLSVDFTPVVTNELGGGIYQAAIRENGYIKSLDISYDVTSFEVLRVTLHIAIGSINKNKVM